MKVGDEVIIINSRDFTHEFKLAARGHLISVGHDDALIKFTAGRFTPSRYGEETCYWVPHDRFVVITQNGYTEPMVKRALTAAILHAEKGTLPLPEEIFNDAIEIAMEVINEGR